MEVPGSAAVKNGDQGLPLDVPPRVLIAVDQLTAAEKEAVLATLQLLERDGLQVPSTAEATRLAGPEPPYVLRPAPDVRVLVRAGSGEPVEV